MTNERIVSLEVDSWQLKAKFPEVLEGAPVFILLHGWTGDENSMWVFADKLTPDALIFAPRGLFPSNHQDYAGFSWIDKTSSKWASWKDFEHSVGKLDELITHLELKYPANFREMNLVGFSQGAAFAGDYLISYSEKVNRLAMLSGFLSEGALPTDADLIGKEIFIGHGTLDETVPLERAKQAGLLFSAAGAEVSYCFSDVGHRLGVDCFRGFNHFFENI